MTGTNWFLLTEGRERPAYNMALDEALLVSAPQIGAPVLRFYGWQTPAATFGYSQKYEEIAQWTSLRPLLRRPTGGGLVSHEADWTYSLCFPPSHAWYDFKAEESYRRAHEWIKGAFERLQLPTHLAPTAIADAPGQCFIGAEKSDVLWEGRKIAGAAQRRTRSGLLVQGSVQMPALGQSRDQWQLAMQEWAASQWGVQWIPFSVTPALRELTRQLEEEKYLSPEYQRRR